MILSSITTSLVGAALPLLASSAVETAMTILRDLVTEITGKNGSDIVATDKITDRVESGDLPTFQTAMANTVGLSSKKLPQLETFGQAARFIADRQG